MKRYLRKQAGFTLLELLMVVIIIAILASIALPQYLRAAERSRAAEALSNLAAIRSAEMRFRAADPNGQYVNQANNFTELDIDVPLQGTGGGPGTSNWDFAVDGTDPTTNPNVTASRRGGTTNGALIVMDLNTGVTCSDTPLYQIGNVQAGLGC